MIDFVKVAVEPRLQNDYSLVSGLKMAEEVGRVSHRSQDKMSDTSYIKFIDNIKRLKHLSVLEFCTVYLSLPMSVYEKRIKPFERKIKGTKYNFSATEAYVSTNYRVICEYKLEDLLDEYLVAEPDYRYFSKRLIFKVMTSIAVTREGNRHRVSSVCEESTRYVNYNKKGISMHYAKAQEVFNAEQRSIYMRALRESAERYRELIEAGATPEYARGVLPLDTASRVYYGAWLEDWGNFTELRGDKNAHPDIQEVAKQIETYIRLCH